MKFRTEADQKHPAEPDSSEAYENWLDGALEDTFPASDPIASYIFD